MGLELLSWWHGADGAGASIIGPALRRIRRRLTEVADGDAAIDGHLSVGCFLRGDIGTASSCRPIGADEADSSAFWRARRPR